MQQLLPPVLREDPAYRTCMVQMPSTVYLGRGWTGHGHSDYQQRLSGNGSRTCLDLDRDNHREGMCSTPKHTRTANRGK